MNYSKKCLALLAFLLCLHKQADAQIGYVNKDGQTMITFERPVIGMRVYGGTPGQAATFDTTGALVPGIVSPSPINWKGIRTSGYYDQVGTANTCVDKTIPDWVNDIPGGQSYMPRYCFGIFFDDFTPGFSPGPAGAAYPEGWQLHEGIDASFTYHGEGIHSALSVSETVPAAGDTQGFNLTLYAQGNWKTPADEGIELFRTDFEEPYGSYTSTVTPDTTRPGAIGAQSILTPCGVCSANNYQGPYLTQGVGQYLAETTPVYTGVVTAIDNTTNAGTLLPKTVTLATAMPSTAVSSAWGTLTSPCYVTITAYNTGTPCTFTVSVTSGTFIAGSLVASNGQYHNQAFITSVSTTGGVATIVMTAAHSIPTGSVIYQGQPRGSSTWSCTGTGLELKANTVGPNMYLYDVIGCQDTTHLQVVAFSTLGSNSFIDEGNVTLTSLGVGAPISSNSSGLITINPNTQTFYMQSYVGGQTITIANSTNFNGQCTNTQLVNNAITCSETGISSALTDANSNATFTLGTTGYGNSSAALHRMAEILDIRSPVTGNADGSFVLEANEMNLVSGTAVQQTFSVEENFTAWAGQQVTHTPYRSGHYAGFNLGYTNMFGSSGLTARDNYFAMEQTNYTPTTSYVYGGGTQMPGAGYGLKGAFAMGFDMIDAPWPIGSYFEHVGCPITGCSDQNYSYNARALDGNNGITYQESWTPYTSTYTAAIGGPTYEYFAMSPSGFQWLSYYPSGHYGSMNFSGVGLAINVPFQAASYQTQYNCSSSASPAVCGSAAAGVVQVAMSGTTLTVNTTAVTSTSEVFFTYSQIACSAPTNDASLLQPRLTALVAGTSFTLKLPVAPTGNPACVQYHVVN
jgi:hypothetical protein